MLNVPDGDLVTWGRLVDFTVLCEVVMASADFDLCGIFDLVGSGKLLWLGKSLGVSFFLTLSAGEGRLDAGNLPVGEVLLKDCAVGMLVTGRWLESDSESVWLGGESCDGVFLVPDKAKVSSNDDEVRTWADKTP